MLFILVKDDGTFSSTTFVDRSEAEAEAKKRGCIVVTGSDIFRAFTKKQDAALQAQQAKYLLGEVLSAYIAIDSINDNPAGRWETWWKVLAKSLKAYPYPVVIDADSLIQVLHIAAEDKSVRAHQLITDVVDYLKSELSESGE